MTNAWTYTRRMLIAGGVALAGVFLLSGTAKASTLQEIVESTVRLYHSDRFACSATYMYTKEGEDYFLTAAHCLTEEGMNIRFIEQNAEEGYRTESIKSYYAIEVDGTEDGDAALIKTYVPTEFMMTPIDIARSEDLLDYGVPVMASGFPAGRELSITYGTFTGKVQHPILEEGEAYRADAAIAPGSSGGGFYHRVGDNEYELIGVSSALLMGSQGMNYFAVHDAVEQALDGVTEEEEQVNRTLEEALKGLNKLLEQE